MTDTHHTQSKEATVPKEQYVRLAADFDNYRKTAERQMEDVVRFGQVGILTEFLDVLDLLERAIGAVPESVESDEWFAGLAQVQKQFVTMLEKFGIRRLDTADKELNPDTMEVVATADGGPSHQVKEEVRAGYALRDRVIRPARVIVYQ